MTALYDVATTLVTKVRDALQEAGTPVNFAAVYPAMIPWDACECGTLAVAVQRQYPTANFPTVTDTDQIGCYGGFFAADLIVQVLRCAPGPEGRSTSASAAALEAAALLSIRDAVVVLSTVPCVLDELVNSDTIVQYAVRPQVFAGPAGGCVGSATGLTVGYEPPSTLV